MLLLVQYPKCSTCKKAEKWLKDNGIIYESRDIKEKNPTEEELTCWQFMSRLPLKRFFNTSGLQYRTLNLSQKLPTMSEKEQITLLASDGMLVKRPLLVGEDFVLVGFREQDWAEKVK